MAVQWLAMGAEIWGTLAVNDHKRRDALVRQVLLFDRLVIPVPATSAERERWRRPNERDPDETWDPDGLDAVLKILGTQRREDAGGDSLAWESDWTLERWQAGRSRVEVASALTEIDAFHSTRLVLAREENLPAIVEAMAAYPSERACALDLAPDRAVPDDLTAADALVLLATPLLVPDVADGDYERALHEAVGLARSGRVREERAAYHDFLRDTVSRLQRPGMDLDEVRLDAASFRLAKDKLERLLRALESEVAGDAKRSRWTIVEWAVTAVGVAATIGLACTQPLAGIGVLGPMFGFGGWIAGKQATTPEPRPLNGAALFVTGSDKLAVFAPTTIG